MVKSSILFTLLLGVMFAQMIQAFPSNSNSGAENAVRDVTDDGEESDTNDADEDSDDESPALTCLLFENLGCDTECSTIASAFSLKGTGKCTDENVCQCAIERYDTLEGLFRAKFKAEEALKQIKKDKDLSAKVLEILQIPFQTIVQTKRQLREVVSPAIYDQLLVDDKTPAWKLGLVGETDELDYDKIKEYVSEKLKPVLKSSSKQLTSVNYKSNMKKSLEGNTNEDLQSIINEARRSKNKNLNDIVDDYLKSAKIEEEKNTVKDDIADAISYQIIDQFVNHIEQKNKPAAKKSARKSSTKNAKKSNTTVKKPKKQEKPQTPKKSSNTEENTKKKGSKSSDDRFKLAGFDKNFLKKLGGSVHKTFASKDYKVYYNNEDDDIYFTWTKGNDDELTYISSDGAISQTWRLDDANISLNLSSDGSRCQSWDFGKTKYTYTKSSEGSWSKNWTDGKKDPDSLKKYQNLIDEWCDKNDFFFTDKKQCIIY